mgnify:CR=1 FL=1
MSLLINLADNSLTDKGTQHTYLGVYEALFENKKNTATDIIEVGIGCFFDKNGGSIKLWKNYFSKAVIHAIDVLPQNRVIDELIDDSRVSLHCLSNAYDLNFVVKNFYHKNIEADIIIDDGEHSLESMKKFLDLYLPILKEDGILVIEDIQEESWLEQLRLHTPEQFKDYIQIFDLRGVKSRYDDILFVINKLKKTDKKY